MEQMLGPNPCTAPSSFSLIRDRAVTFYSNLSPAISSSNRGHRASSWENSHQLVLSHIFLLVVFDDLYKEVHLLYI